MGYCWSLLEEFCKSRVNGAFNDQGIEQRAVYKRCKLSFTDSRGSTVKYR